MFSAICLRVPLGSADQHSSLTSAVKKNIMDFTGGKCLPESPVDTVPRNTSISNTSRANSVQAKLADGDVRGAVRILSSEDTFAPVNDQTLEALLTQHPDPVPCDAPPVQLDNPLHVPLQVTEPEVRGAIASFPAGSAGGLDFLRPQHLKDLTSHSAGVAGTKLLTSLTRFCNILLAGGVPAVICPLLYGAALCAFTKKSGGIRPIAVGCTLRRLVAKLCSYHLVPRLGGFFQPVQFGFGTKRGIEIATHLCRRYVNYPHGSPKFFLKVDYSNAFNSLHRSQILHSVSTLMPELFSFVNQCYGSDSSLAFGDIIIPSARGVQQGDPLGPAIFCAVIQPVAMKLNSELNVWYLDDGSLGGDLDEVFRDFSTLLNSSASLGLDINASKCELFGLGVSPEEEQEALTLFQTIAPDIRLLPLPECTQLGTPLFTSAASTFLEDKTTILRRITGRLLDIPAQSAFYILKHSQAIPKLSHFLRCAPSWLCPTELSNFDDVLREALSTISNISLSDMAWTQSSWPVSSGGLGIRHASDIALPAFLASMYGSRDQVELLLPKEISASTDPLLTEGVEAWKAISNSSPPPSDRNHIQREWDQPLIDLSIKNTISMATSPLDKARILGVSSSESGAFLNALPSASLGTLLDNDSFRIAVALRLGSNICIPHSCGCGAWVTESGVHGLSCRKSSGRITRHSSANAIIHRALASAGIPSTLEPSHITGNSNLRPDGATNIPWSGGKSLIWDFTCTDGLAPSHVDFSSGEHLYAASLAEHNKRAKYEVLARNYIFVPVAIECLGSLGREGLKFLREVGRRITAYTGETRATEYLLQRLSVAVQRGNALAVQGTHPPTVNLDDCLSQL